MTNIKNLSFSILIALAFCVGMQACSGGETSPDSGKLKVVCTTGIVADAVAAVGGEHIQVTALMGPGVDPHLYKVTQGDLGRLTDADIVFYNGLHLEGKMADVLKKLSRNKTVIPLSDGIPAENLIHNADFADAHDPHIWFDISIWSDAVGTVAQTLKTHDSEHATAYQANFDSLKKSYTELHQWVKSEIETIPLERRVLVTAHDAFVYFGRAYGIEVKGLQGISTMSEYGLQDVTNMVDFIVEGEIKAVFVESSVPKRSLEAVVEGCNGKGHDVIVGGTLYSDAMGAKGSPEGTYLGMVKANVNTIVKALK